MLWRRAFRSQIVMTQKHYKSSYYKLSYCGSNHYWLSPWKNNFNKRQSHFGEKKNNKLIGKKPSNPVKTEEKNRCRKVLVVVTSFRINFLLWLIVCKMILLHLQSTIAAGDTLSLIITAQVINYIGHESYRSLTTLVIGYIGYRLY